MLLSRFCATIREIRDFDREKYGTNRESVTLQENPALCSKIRSLFGDEYSLYDHAADRSPLTYQLDREPRLLSRSDRPLADCLDAEERVRLRYDDMRARPDVAAALGTQPNATGQMPNVSSLCRLAQFLARSSWLTPGSDEWIGLRVLLALEPTSDVAIVPCSHKSDPAYPPPETLAQIEALRGTIIRPTLAAGDAILLAAPTVVAIESKSSGREASAEAPSSRVLELLLVDPNLCAPGLGYELRPLNETPRWFQELAPAQQAVLGLREGRPAKSVATNGHRVWADPAPSDFGWAAGQKVAANVQSPLMKLHEVWQWETQNYLIVSGVMDKEWIAAANLAIDTFRDSKDVVRQIGASELWQEPDCSPSLLPSAADEDGGPMLEERMTGLEGLPKPHCDAFRRMVAHPAVVERLNWMMGP
eukprot:SAG31_NODE_243_length_19342_cov_12.906459_20_plen_419_part_00